MMNPGRLLLSLTLLLVATSVSGEELIKWERIPLPIPLAIGKERVVFVDRNVRVGFPAALNDKLRAQSSGGAVYLKAAQAFPLTRLQLQDVENGELILLDISTSESAPSEPVRIVWQGDVTSVTRHQEVMTHTPNNAVSNAVQRTPSAPARYPAPIPVVLTRYAAQSLYGPLRTVEAVPGIRSVSPHLPKRITTLYPSQPLNVIPLAAWAIDQHYVVALKLQNRSQRTLSLDPRMLQGRFIAATFQHYQLGPAGSPEDTTTLYLVTRGRPDGALVAEPLAKPTEKKGKSDGKR